MPGLAPYTSTPYQRKSRTSKMAAEAVKPRASNLRDKVEEALKNRGLYGATDEELADLTDIYLYTMAPRRVELVKMGHAKPLEGSFRPTKRNRLAQVWIYVPVEERDNSQLSFGGEDVPI